MIHHSKEHHIEYPFLYGMAVLAIILLSNISAPWLQRSLEIIDSVSDEKVVSDVLFNPSAFNDVSIKGKSYVVYDVIGNTIIASKNEKEVLPLASITKVMTALTARLHNDRNTLITIEKKDIEDSYDLGLRNKQVWTLDELLKYTLVFSSNDGAQAIAGSFGGNSTFVKQMNSDARAYGLSLLFTDPAGRDQQGNIGGLGSAFEVAKLFTVARKTIPQILDATTKTRFSARSSFGKVTGIPNTNQDVEHLSGVEGSKTGFTDKAGGNLGVVVDITLGHPVVIIVLGSTKEGRFSDVEILYKALRKSVENLK